MNDYYQILEVEPNASQAQIKNQYRFLVQAWHPDKFGSPESKAKSEEKLKQINEAFNVLKDPVKRSQYDRQRQYSQKGYSHQAQDEHESQRYEQEARTKARQREQAEAQRREQEARAEEERRSEDRTDPKRQEEQTKKNRETRPIVKWTGVVFAIFLVGFVIRGFSALFPITLIATETYTQTPATLTKAPAKTETPIATETLLPTIFPETSCSSPTEWEAQNTMLGGPPTRIGRPDGDGWSANTGQDQFGYLQYGPYTTEVDVGDHVVTWALMIDNNSYDDLPVVRLEVSDYTTGTTILASRDISRREWSKTFEHECFYLPFNLDSSRLGHHLEFRILWYGVAYVHLTKVGLK